MPTPQAVALPTIAQCQPRQTSLRSCGHSLCMAFHSYQFLSPGFTTPLAGLSGAAPTASLLAAKPDVSVFISSQPSVGQTLLTTPSLLRPHSLILSYKILIALCHLIRPHFAFMGSLSSVLRPFLHIWSWPFCFSIFDLFSPVSV